MWKTQEHHVDPVDGVDVEVGEDEVGVGGREARVQRRGERTGLTVARGDEQTEPWVLGDEAQQFGTGVARCADDCDAQISVHEHEHDHTCRCMFIQSSQGEGRLLDHHADAHSCFVGVRQTAPTTVGIDDHHRLRAICRQIGQNRRDPIESETTTTGIGHHPSQLDIAHLTHHQSQVLDHTGQLVFEVLTRPTQETAFERVGERPSSRPDRGADRGGKVVAEAALLECRLEPTRRCPQHGGVGIVVAVEQVVHRPHGDEGIDLVGEHSFAAQERVIERDRRDLGIRQQLEQTIVDRSQARRLEGRGGEIGSRHRGRCLLGRPVDGFDCADGSDELDCAFFVCSPRERISSALRCDGTEDCEGGEDELSCEGR